MPELGPTTSIDHAVTKIREQVLGYPETVEDRPWGEPAFKVKGKVFIFLYEPESGLSLSVKIPELREFALDLPFASPTGYGLGRTGWVTAKFDAGEEVPLDLLHYWVLVSYRTIAPKRLGSLVPDLRRNGDEVNEGKP